jgi:catechol 2,3-dioxygenase-like lactoylglutathione lyase family enzyme
MDEDLGAPPRSGWARLAPELLVEDIAISLRFWRDRLGFAIAYQRPEERFVYLEHPDGAQIMLSQRTGRWETAPMERPLGRGVMFQVYVDNLDAVSASLAAFSTTLYAGPREVWRRHGDREGGQREIFVQDPDGYLVMIAQNIGERPLST